MLSDSTTSKQCFNIFIYVIPQDRHLSLSYLTDEKMKDREVETDRKWKSPGESFTTPLTVRYLSRQFPLNLKMIF